MELPAKRAIESSSSDESGCDVEIIISACESEGEAFFEDKENVGMDENVKKSEETEFAGNVRKSEEKLLESVETQVSNSRNVSESVETGINAANNVNEPIEPNSKNVEKLSEPVKPEVKTESLSEQARREWRESLEVLKGAAKNHESNYSDSDCSSFTEDEFDSEDESGYDCGFDSDDGSGSEFDSEFDTDYDTEEDEDFKRYSDDDANEAQLHATNHAATSVSLNNEHQFSNTTQPQIQHRVQEPNLPVVEYTSLHDRICGLKTFVESPKFPLPLNPRTILSSLFGPLFFDAIQPCIFKMTHKFTFNEVLCDVKDRPELFLFVYRYQHYFMPGCEKAETRILNKVPCRVFLNDALLDGEFDGAYNITKFCEVHNTLRIECPTDSPETRGLVIQIYSAQLANQQALIAPAAPAQIQITQSVPAVSSTVADATATAPSATPDQRPPIIHQYVDLNERVFEDYFKRPLLSELLLVCCQRRQAFCNISPNCTKLEITTILTRHAVKLFRALKVNEFNAFFDYFNASGYFPILMPKLSPAVDGARIALLSEEIAKRLPAPLFSDLWKACVCHQFGPIFLDLIEFPRFFTQFKFHLDSAAGKLLYLRWFIYGDGYASGNYLAEPAETDSSILILLNGHDIAKRGGQGPYCDVRGFCRAGENVLEVNCSREDAKKKGMAFDLVCYSEPKSYREDDSNWYESNAYCSIFGPVNRIAKICYSNFENHSLKEYFEQGKLANLRPFAGSRASAPFNQFKSSTTKAVIVDLLYRHAAQLRDEFKTADFNAFFELFNPLYCFTKKMPRLPPLRGVDRLLAVSALLAPRFRRPHMYETVRQTVFGPIFLSDAPKTPFDMAFDWNLSYELLKQSEILVCFYKCDSNAPRFVPAPDLIVVVNGSELFRHAQYRFYNITANCHSDRSNRIRFYHRYGELDLKDYAFEIVATVPLARIAATRMPPRYDNYVRNREDDSYGPGPIRWTNYYTPLPTRQNSDANSSRPNPSPPAANTAQPPRPLNPSAQPFTPATVLPAIENFGYECLRQEPTLHDRQSTLFLMNNQSDDIQLADDSIAVDLRCPISMARIKRPVRFSTCKHLQCFDYEVFRQFASNGLRRGFMEKIDCPVCSSKISKGIRLIECGLMKEILAAPSTQSLSKVKIDIRSGAVIQSAPEVEDLDDGSDGESGLRQVMSTAAPIEPIDCCYEPKKALIFIDICDSEEENRMPRRVN